MLKLMNAQARQAYSLRWNLLLLFLFHSFIWPFQVGQVPIHKRISYALQARFMSDRLDLTVARSLVSRICGPVVATSGLQESHRRAPKKAQAQTS